MPRWGKKIPKPIIRPQTKMKIIGARTYMKWRRRNEFFKGKLVGLLLNLAKGFTRKQRTQASSRSYFKKNVLNKMQNDYKSVYSSETVNASSFINLTDSGNLSNALVATDIIFFFCLL